jgi:hypothetical protein
MKIQGSLVVPNLNVITTVDNNTMQRALNLSLLNNTVYTCKSMDTTRYQFMKNKQQIKKSRIMHTNVFIFIV